MGGFLVVAFPPAGVVPGSGALLPGAVLGAVPGGVVTALLGSQVHDRKLDGFRRALSAGRILLMVDIPRWSDAETRAIIHKRHPEAEIVSAG